MTEHSQKKIVFVIPCYNDQDTLTVLYQRLDAVMEKLRYNWEILFINDGSRDQTWPVVCQLQQSRHRIKGINLSRNFGHQMAITAGLDHAEGDAVIVMDSDLQDPPEAIPALIDKWEKGAHIVHAIHAGRSGDSLFKKLTAQWFYRLIKKLAGNSFQSQSGDFKLIDRKSVEALRAIRERHRYLRGLTVWTGFNQDQVVYTRQTGLRRQSGYTLKKLIYLAFDAIASFSILPLRLAFLAGFILFSLSIFSVILVIGLKVFYGIPYRGWTSLFIGITFFSGIQLLVLGIIGEYTGRIYEEVKRRPLYFVEDFCGMEAAPIKRPLE